MAGGTPAGTPATAHHEAADGERARLMDAFTELMAERGYDAVRVEELVRRAGVPRAAFRRQFPDKEACLLAAYDRFSATMTEAILGRIDSAAPWSAFIETLLGAYIDVLERHPTAARAFYVEIDAAGPAVFQRRRHAAHAFARMLAERHAEIRAREPALAELPPDVYLALAFAVRGLVHDALLDLDGPSFRELAPGIASFANAVVIGAGEAQRSIREP